MKPRIAIPMPNSDAEYCTRALPDYLNSLVAAGAEPVLLPLDLTPQEAAQRIKQCDGILLPGSPTDVEPQKYGAERQPIRPRPMRHETTWTSCCCRTRTPCASRCWASATERSH